MAKRKLTTEQRAALLTLVVKQMELWDAAQKAEDLLGCELDTGEESGLKDLAACFEDATQVQELSDADLIEDFELEKQWALGDSDAQ